MEIIINKIIIKILMDWIILTLLSAVLIAIHDYISKSVLNKKIQPLQIIFIQSLVIFLSALFLFSQEISFQLDLFNSVLIILKVLFLQSFVFFFFNLLKDYSASKIVPLTNVSPIFLIILSFIILEERISLLGLIGILIIILSTYYLEFIMQEHKNKSKKKYGRADFIILAQVFIMLFSISMCAIIDKALLISISVYTNIFYTYFLSFFILAIYFIYNKSVFTTFRISYQHPVIIVSSIFLFFSTILVLTAIAIPDSLISFIIPLRRTSTLMVAIFSGVLFHEKKLLNKIISICVMLFGIFLIYI